jgi:hypothetical protein
MVRNVQDRLDKCDSSREFAMPLNVNQQWETGKKSRVMVLKDRYHYHRNYNKLNIHRGPEYSVVYKSPGFCKVCARLVSKELKEEH